MLAAIGAGRTDELYAAIPASCCGSPAARHRAAVGSEVELRRRARGDARPQHVGARGAELPGRRLLAALRARRWCDEIVNRGEFLTAYYGETYGDHGKLQALFEFASLLGELVECDAVSAADLRLGHGGGDARSAWRPASRAGGGRSCRRRSAASGCSMIDGYCEPWVT